MPSIPCIRNLLIIVIENPVIIEAIAPASVNRVQNKDKIRKTVLCKSLAGNDVDMLIVTNFLSDPVDIAVRKSIILSSRVHPGESNASWLMNGVIDFLVSDD